MTSEDPRNTLAIAALINEDFSALSLPVPVHGPSCTLIRPNQDDLLTNVLRLNHVRHLSEVEITTSNQRKAEKANKNHKFLMSKMKIPTAVDELSQARLESDRSERAMFVRELMLATIQNQTSLP